MFTSFTCIRIDIVPILNDPTRRVSSRRSCLASVLLSGPTVQNVAGSAGMARGLRDSSGSLSNSPHSVSTPSPPTHNPESPHQVTTINGQKYLTDLEGTKINLDDITAPLLDENGAEINISVSELLGFDPPYDIVAIDPMDFDNSGSTALMELNNAQSISLNADIETDDATCSVSGKSSNAHEVYHVNHIRVYHVKPSKCNSTCAY